MASNLKTRPQRPLSPHLFIYRLQLPAILSFGHRLTGVALSVGTLLLAAWLIAAATGPAAFAAVQWFIGSWLGLLLLFAWSGALFYHLLNGVRHLAWDAGYGFALKSAHASGWAVVAGALALTLVAWAAAIARLA